MTPGAGVRSLDALKDWYVALSLFRGEGQEAETSLRLSLLRAEEYLNRQQVFWKKRIREIDEEIVQAKAELSSRKWKDKDGHHPDTTVQEENLELARARMEDAEERLEACRKWHGHLPSVIRDIFEGPNRRLAFFLDIELPKALAELAKQITALEQYLGLQPSALPATSAGKDSP